VDQDAVKQEINNLGYTSAIIPSAARCDHFIIRLNATNLDEAAKNKVINSISDALGLKSQ